LIVNLLKNAAATKNYPARKTIWQVLADTKDPKNQVATYTGAGISE